MKIAMVSEHASPLAALGGVDAGGQNVHVAELSRALAARGNEVVVYTRRDAADLARRVPLCPGVTVEHLDAGPPRAIAKDDLLPHIPELGRQLAETPGRRSSRRRARPLLDERARRARGRGPVGPSGRPDVPRARAS